MGSADFDAASTDTTVRLNGDIRTKHRSNAERIDRADGVNLAAAKLNAVFCPIAGKRVGVENNVGRRVAAQQIVRLQLGNERSQVFRGEASLFADFMQVQRPARSRKKLKHCSPHAVLRRLQSVIPSFGKTDP